MGFLNTDSMPRLVEKLADGDNIKITGNSKGSRVGTVIKKIVEKADDVTKAIEQEVINDSYSFKVGTGNVDISADVQDGFGEVGIKGVTYQNIVKSYEVTNFSLLNATIEQGYFKIKHAENVNSSFVKVKVGTHLYKPNTKYTVIVDIKENTCDKNLGMSAILSCVSNLNPKNFINKTGISMSVITTRADISVDDKGNKPILDLYFGIWEEGGDLSNHITFRYWILEGDHTNNPNLPSYFEGIVGVGDKSKNLFIKEFFEWENSNINSDTGENQDGGFTHIARTNNYMELKKGNYTISWKIIDDKYVEKVLIYDKDTNFIRSIHNSENNTVKSFTVDSDSLIRLTLRDGKSSTGGTNPIPFIDAMEIQLEEGTQPTEYEKGWRGHKIEILSCGKNLINLKDMPSGSLDNSGKVVMSPTSASKVTPNFIKIEPTRKVCFYYEYDENDTSTPTHNMIAYYDKNFSYIGAVYDLSPKGILKTPPAQAYYLRLRVRKEAIKLSLIFESSIVYEPYVSDKTQILLDEPLMRLPNGVCDEIVDGKLIKRVGKTVLDGSENWIYHNSNSNTISTYIYWLAMDGFGRKLSGDNAICDNAVVGKNSEYTSIGFVTSGFCYLNVLKTTLDNNGDVISLKSYLAQNPITVYYELAEPVITELSAPYLRIFKDGHITFNTLVAPESNHVVQLNKSAQIERSIREVQSLDSRVGQLESFYDDMMLETSHKLSLLTYDFEYTRESEDI